MLKSGGHAIFVLGNSNIAGQMFDTVGYAERIAHDLRMKVTLKLVDNIHSRGLMTKRNATASIITQETVLVLEKV